MATVLTDTNTQANTSLSHCSVDDVLTEFFNYSLLEMVDVAYRGVAGALPRLHSRLD